MDLKSLRFIFFLFAVLLPFKLVLASYYDISITAPDFIVPLDGKSGALDIFSDLPPSLITGGDINVLNNQTSYAPSDSTGGVVSENEIKLRNTPDSIRGNMPLKVAPEPEPNIVALLGLSLLFLTIISRRRITRVQEAQSKVNAAHEI
jgi:hypothetical protein